MSQYSLSAESRVNSKRKREYESILQLRYKQIEYLEKEVARDLRPYEIPDDKEGDDLSPFSFSVQYRDPRFKPINVQQMLDNFQMYDTDQHIAVVANLVNMGALSGGVIVRVNGKPLRPEHQRWVSDVYTQYGIEAMRQDDSNARVVMAPIPHPKYTGKPVCMNMDRFIPLHYRGLFGRDDWVFVEKPDMSQFNTPGEKVKARVFEHLYVETSKGPDQFGNVSSRVSRLRRDIAMEKISDLCAMRADLRRSNPDLIIESEMEKYDAERARPVKFQILSQAARTRDAYPAALNKRESASLSDGSFFDAQQKTWVSAYREYHGERQEHTSLTHGAIQPTAHSDTVQQEAQALFELNHGPVRGYVRELPPGHHVARQVLPEAPAERMDLFLRAQQRTFMMWGVPPAMMSAQSSQKRTTAMDPNALQTWYTMIREKKRWLTSLFKRAWLIIHTPVVLEELAFTLPPTKKLTKQMAEEAMQVEIDLPGLPPPEELHNLYQLGILKYESYTETLAQLYSMPKSAFEPKPKLALDDLLTQGKTLLPPPASAAGSKPKAKAKAKSKPKTRASSRKG